MCVFAKYLHRLISLPGGSSGVEALTQSDYWCVQGEGPPLFSKFLSQFGHDGPQ